MGHNAINFTVFCLRYLVHVSGSVKSHGAGSCVFNLRPAKFMTEASVAEMSLPNCLLNRVTT